MNITNTTEELQVERDVRALTGQPCGSCRLPITGQDAVCSIVMGFKDRPYCLACLANVLQQPLPELREQLIQYIQRRECYLRAWLAAERKETPAPDSARPLSPVEQEPLENSSTWDAGELSCGDLVLSLRRRLQGLPPGALLTLIARDPAAPHDLPAWCKLTGHSLLRAEHPHYLIQRKGD